MTNPVIFAAPADVKLDPAPIPASWIVEGTPQARSKRLVSSADGSASVMAWSCTPGRFTWRYNVDEIIHVISGEVFVTDEKGESRRLGPGDMVYFPAGSVSTWHVTKELKKFAVCRHSMPPLFGLALRVWKKLVSILSGPPEEADPLESAPVAIADPERITAG